MSDTSTTSTSATPPATASVSFTLDEASQLINAAGAALVAFVPADAAIVAGLTGLVAGIQKLAPIIQQLHAKKLTVDQQAQLAAEAAASRSDAGAPAATVN